MTTFGDAWDTERAAHREVRRWRALYRRERPRMASLPSRAADRPHWRLKDEGHAAEDRHRQAEAALDAEWHRLSHRLAPRGRQPEIDEDGHRAIIAAGVQLSLARLADLDVTMDESLWLCREACERGFVDVGVTLDDAVSLILGARGLQ